MKFELKAVNLNETSVQQSSSEEYRKTIKEFYGSQLRDEKLFRVLLQKVLRLLAYPSLYLPIYFCRQYMHPSSSDTRYN
jgi:hypothetical protein